MITNNYIFCSIFSLFLTLFAPVRAHVLYICRNGEYVGKQDILKGCKKIYDLKATSSRVNRSPLTGCILTVHSHFASRDLYPMLPRAPMQ